METQSGGSKKSAASKWLVGCGIGCGVVLLVIIIIGVSGYFFVRNIVQGFKETEDTMKVLTERYGKINEFCPNPDGAIRPERIEAFLAVRSAMGTVIKELESDMNLLSTREHKGEAKEEPSPGVFTRIKTGLGMVTLIAEFIKSRNDALLKNEMGIGEYYYIYVVTFYSWLGKSPADGPPFQLTDEQNEDRRIIIRRHRETEEERLDYMLRRIHRQILPMLQNQYAKLTEGGVPKARAKWSKALAAEIEAMDSDRFRIPWKNGVPEALKASLEPFRERLEANYSRLLNPIEISVVEERYGERLREEK